MEDLGRYFTTTGDQDKYQPCDWTEVRKLSSHGSNISFPGPSGPSNCRLRAEAQSVTVAHAHCTKDRFGLSGQLNPAFVRSMHSPSRGKGERPKDLMLTLQLTLRDCWPESLRTQS